MNDNWRIDCEQIEHHAREVERLLVKTETAGHLDARAYLANAMERLSQMQTAVERLQMVVAVHIVEAVKQS